MEPKDSERVISVYKPPGKTPLEAIRMLQEKYPALKAQKIGYAGRLDPMAEGLLLLLVGDENKKKSDYEQLPKTYVCDALFGITTDSYDALGMVTAYTAPPPLASLRKSLASLMPTLSKKTLMLQVPGYSAKRENGKPLYYWQRRGIGKIVTQNVFLSDARMNTLYDIPKEEILKTVTHTIPAVQGDFRQKEIIQRWETVLDAVPFSSFPVARLTLSCSSGTYIRSIVSLLGELMMCGAISWRLRRTTVGLYKVEDALAID